MKNFVYGLIIFGVFGSSLIRDAKNVVSAKKDSPSSTVSAAPVSPSLDSAKQYKQKTVYDFDDDQIEGDLTRPDGELIDAGKRAKNSLLIKIREDFIPEMLKEVDSL